MVKLKTVGSREHFEKEFRLRESFELCRNMGKNLFVAEGYLIDDERREGGTRNTRDISAFAPFDTRLGLAKR